MKLITLLIIAVALFGAIITLHSITMLIVLIIELWPLIAFIACAIALNALYNKLIK